MQNKKKFPIPYRRYHKTAARRPVGGGFLLFVFSLFLLIAAIKALSSGNSFGFIASSISFAMMLGGAWCIRKGLYYQAQALQRKWNRSTRVPWRVSGSILVAVSTAVASLFVAGQPLIIALGSGLGALAGCLLDRKSVV